MLLIISDNFLFSVCFISEKLSDIEIVYARWSPHPVIVAIRDQRDYIRVFINFLSY